MSSETLNYRATNKEANGSQKIQTIGMYTREMLLNVFVALLMAHVCLVFLPQENFSASESLPTVKAMPYCLKDLPHKLSPGSEITDVFWYSFPITESSK